LQNIVKATLYNQAKCFKHIIMSSKTNLKIAICGAHGTGKTTLVKLVAERFSTIAPLQRIVANYWDSVGVSDFELLPQDIRNVFQNHLLLNHIQTEDNSNINYVTDRSVIDYYAHTVLDTNKSLSELAIYEALVLERVKNYSLIVYCPIEFAVESRALRADVSKQGHIDSLIQAFFAKWSIPVLKVTGSPEARLEQVALAIKELL
jgi:nicotinamide riboside kinase